MASKFNIIEYASSLIGYPVPQKVVARIIDERGLMDVTDWTEVSTRDKNLIIASLLFYLFTSPSNTGSRSKQHGDFTVTIGGTIITDKNDIFALMNRIWQNPDREMSEILADMGCCQWMY